METSAPLHTKPSARSSTAFIVAAAALTAIAAAGCTSCRSDESTACSFQGDALLQPGRHDRELSWDGAARTYILHVPTGYDGRNELPVVIMLHGGFGSAENAATHYGWREKADAETFFAVFPDGVGVVQTWNAAHCCGAAKRDGVDDVGFIAALIDEIDRLACIDRGRVYVTGMSNGGMMAHRLGAERPDLFAAIAPVAASIGGQQDAAAPLEMPAPPSAPVPVIMFHGTADMHVLYDGGQSQGVSETRIDLPVSEAVSFWVEANDCQTTPQQNLNATGNVRRDLYAHRGNGADVVLFTIVGQGHAWPGGLQPTAFSDPPSTEVSATDEIWDFFATRSRG